MKTTLLLTACFLTLQSALCLADPLDTAFTYQGRLNDGGSPAMGTYDLRFTIYDSLSGGSVAGGPITNSPVLVTNGLFTVTLDFGAGVFDGANRWLEIGVRSNGVAADFTSLSPRQELTPTPYALYAPNAGAATTATTATSVAANGVTSSSLQTGAVTSDKIADASVTESDLAPALALNTFWRLDGNAGTTPGAQFLGTSDNQPLELQVNKTRALRLEPTADDANHSDIINVVGGSPVNYIAPGTYGSVVLGGGAANYYGHSGSNSVASEFSVLGGGYDNSIQPDGGFSVLIGGDRNSIGTEAWSALLGGGDENTIGTSAYNAVLIGGALNTIESDAVETFLGGGSYNSVQSGASDSVLGGGMQNSVGTNANFAFLGGGRTNRIESEATAVVLAGGYRNRVGPYANYSALVGGHDNTVEENAWSSFLGGGEDNAIRYDAPYSVLGGGQGNTIQTNATYSVLGGGRSNSIEADTSRSFLGAGYGNSIHAPSDAVIVGGYRNTNLAGSSFIGGGSGNAIQTNASGSVISGGSYNTIQSDNQASFVGGGASNDIETNASYSALVGGRNNAIQPNSYSAFLGGGNFNTIQTNADYAVLSGGYYNTSGGTYSVVPGGVQNLAAGDRSFAAGNRAKALHKGDFVWADSQNADFAATGADQFLIRAAGGVGINKNNPGTALDVNGTVTATAFNGSGSSLSSLSGSSITSGTVADARIASTLARDNEIMPTVLANDGAGSGLDADTLDGLNSTAFATASHDHYGASWTGSAARGLSVQTGTSSIGGAALYGRQGTGSGWSVARSAGVLGDSSDSYGVIATTISTNSGALYASAFASSGTSYGVFGASYSPDGVGMIGYGSGGGGVALRATGSGIIQSTADSYVFVPGNVLVKNISTDTTRWDIQVNGAARIWGGTTTGTKSVYFPITIPAQLYGQPVTVESARIYYVCSNPTNSYISATYLYKQTDADSTATLVSDGTDRSSTTATYYTITPSSNNALSSDQGVLGCFLNLYFANNTDYVQVGGIRLQLSHE